MNVSAKAEGHQVYLTEERYGHVLPLMTLSLPEATILRGALHQAIEEASMSLLERKRAALADLHREVYLLERTSK